MKFKSILLRNFQKHKKLEIVFSPRINTICGPTDCGKSALLRALRWICFNDWQGKDFIREGAERAKVVLTVSHRKELYVITRIKGKENLYFLGEDEFKSFATTVPDEISQLLRLNENNFQGQHDAPFWFSQTAGEVSRRLNAVVDLTIIDNTLAAAASRLRQASDRKVVCAERLQQINEEREALEPMRERIEDFQALQKRNEDKQRITADYDRLRQSLDNARSHRKEALSRQEQVSELSVLVANCERWESLRKGHNALEFCLRRATELSKCRRPPSFDAIATDYGKWHECSDQVERLNCLLQSMEAGQEQLERSKTRAKKADKDYHAAIQGEKCPLCSQLIV